MSLAPAKIADVNSFWRYWGKARPVEESAGALLPLLYLFLEMAAISSCRWDGTESMREIFAHAFGVAEQARTASVLLAQKATDAHPVSLGLARIRWAEAQY